MKTFAMPRPRHALAATGLCVLALPALAQDPAAVSALVYGGGEALSPQAESQLRALQLPAERSLSRAEVVEQFLEARAAGTLPGPGDAADRPAVLQARYAANQRQTQQLLAAREAAEREAAQLAAAAEAERLAQAREAAAAAPAATDSAAAPGTLATTAGGEPVGLTAAAPDAAPANDSPEPTPGERPGAPVAPLAPAAPTAPARPAVDDEES